MTNYTKTTDFAAKDSLPSGDSGKIIRGSEFETEFDNIATAVNSKSDANNPTFTGTVTIDGLTVNGNTVLGNAATDTVTVTADIASNLIPSADDTYNLGASGAEWNDLYVDGTAHIDAINFNGTAITATAAELNIMDGVTATTTELNYVDGVTSAIQTQIDTKAPTASPTFTGTVTVPGLTTTADVSFGDNDKAIFGAGSDLQIFAVSGNSFIQETGSGSLFVTGASAMYFQNGSNETYFDAFSNGAVRLFYDNALRLATTTTGIDVTGSVSADGLTVSDGTETTSIPATADRVSFTGATSNFIQSSASLFVQPTGDLVLNGTGAEIMRLKSGKVGIGTTSPTSQLHLSKAGGTLIKLGTSQNTSEIEAREVGTANSLVFSSNNSVDHMIIAPNGNVGINTDSPFGRLSVDVVSAAPASSGNMTNGFTVHNSSGGRAIQLGVNETGAYNYLQSSYVNNANVAVDMAFFMGASEAMRIDSAGRVGIGTANPQSTLQVDGTFTATGDMFLHEATSSSSNAVEIGRNRTVDGDVFLDLTTSTTEGDFNFRLNRGSGTNGALLLRNRGTGAMLFFTNDTEAARIDSSGHLIVPNGVTLGTSVGTYVAANTLDDYEEGTFTVAVEGSTTAGTGTYATRNARYTKIGNIVHARIYINMSAHTGAGNLLITGLPFNSKNAANEFVTASIDFSNGISKTADNYIYGLLRPNTSQLEVQRQPVSGTSTVWNLDVPLDTAFQAAINITYTTD